MNTTSETGCSIQTGPDKAATFQASGKKAPAPLPPTPSNNSKGVATQKGRQRQGHGMRDNTRHSLILHEAIKYSVVQAIEWQGLVKVVSLVMLKAV